MLKVWHMVHMVKFKKKHLQFHHPSLGRDQGARDILISVTALKNSLETKTTCLSLQLHLISHQEQNLQDMATQVERLVSLE